MAGNSSAYSKDISSDGRYIVFSSSSSNLTSQTLQEENLYLLDTQDNQLKVINKDNTGEIRSGEMGAASISQDGRFVAFSAKAKDLHPISSANVFNVFLKDIIL